MSLRVSSRRRRRSRVASRAQLSVGRDAINARALVDAALNVVAKQREDRQQAREELGERVVERAAERFAK